MRFCRYLRLNRDRLKGDGNTEKDWHDALSTTYTVLLNMCVYDYLRRAFLAVAFLCIIGTTAKSIRSVSVLALILCFPVVFDKLIDIGISFD